MAEEFDEFDELELEEDDETEAGKYLTFNLDNEAYGLEITYITEIIGIQKITEVPELPEYVKGIMSLRGQIIPVVDVRLRFGKPDRTYDERTCVIVVEISCTILGGPCRLINAASVLGVARRVSLDLLINTRCWNCTMGNCGLISSKGGGRNARPLLWGPRMVAAV